MSYTINPKYKPDTALYSPDSFFAYDLKRNEYKPKDELDPDIKMEVLYTIEKLGINAESTITDRRACLGKIQADLEYGNKTRMEIQNDIDEFPTAIMLSGILN